jgi:adenylylsulfate kinase-like enzyme
MGGRIRFAPVEGAAGAESYAEIKTDGTFVLQSFGGRDGVMPGSYKVSLSGKAMTGIAAKFQAPESSTLRVEITKDQKDLGTIKFQ